MHRVAELHLILRDPVEPVEPGADLVFQDRAPQVDHFPRRRRRGETGQAFAHQHCQRIR